MQSLDMTAAVYDILAQYPADKNQLLVPTQMGPSASSTFSLFSVSQLTCGLYASMEGRTPSSHQATTLPGASKRRAPNPNPSFPHIGTGLQRCWCRHPSERSGQIFDPGLRHCVDYNKDGFPACPVSPEHASTECQHYKNITNADDRGTESSVHTQNKLHWLYHLASGDIIICDCGRLFPNVYLAMWHFLPKNMFKKGKKQSRRKRDSREKLLEDSVPSLGRWLCQNVSDTKLPRVDDNKAPILHAALSLERRLTIVTEQLTHRLYMLMSFSIGA
jgi:hypothetical protein